jgi:hypothetical protein
VHRSAARSGASDAFESHGQLILLGSSSRLAPFADGGDPPSESSDAVTEKADDPLAQADDQADERAGLETVG